MGSSLVSFRGFYPTRPPPSRRRLLQQGCAWNRLRFLESPGSFLDPKQTFKSKSLLTGSFKVILCAKLLKPQLFGIFQKQAPGGCFSKVLVAFRAQKAVYICHIYIQDRSFNNFENDTMRLSVNEAKTDWF